MKYLLSHVDLSTTYLHELAQLLAFRLPNIPLEEGFCDMSSPQARDAGSPAQNGIINKEIQADGYATSDRAMELRCFVI
jgi:hypothetical protein